MNIYHLTYQKGIFKVLPFNIIKKNKYSYTVKEVGKDYTEMLFFEETDTISEYSLGSIGIWYVGENNLILARKKLVKYAINFHESNVKRLENNALEHRAWLQPLYEMRGDKQ